LLDQAGSCEGNGVFVEASKACLEKLNAEETARGKLLEEHAEKAVPGQSRSTGAARDGYAATITAMSQLQSLTEQGRTELLAYEPFVALPSLEEAPLLDEGGLASEPAAL
jgi:hypothetical protein